MPFQPGNKLGKGRPAGALNRTTEQAKLAIARLANSGLDALREDIEKIRKTDPVEAARINLKLLEYIVPKKSQLELQGELHHKVHQISVVINKGTTNDNERIAD